jgi:glutamate-5-semialdehyde dehydrogenase
LVRRVLDYKIVIGTTNSDQEAIDKINKYCGGHLAFDNQKK